VCVSAFTGWDKTPGCCRDSEVAIDIYTEVAPSLSWLLANLSSRVNSVGGGWTV